MKKIDNAKLSNLPKASDILDQKYGTTGTPSRTAFNEESVAWYYGEILKEKRKELKLTQQQLADRIGKERSYIARIEKGTTDMQLSSLVRIAQALGLRLSLS